jgi:hypothetical protein
MASSTQDQMRPLHVWTTASGKVKSNKHGYSELPLSSCMEVFMPSESSNAGNEEAGGFQPDVPGL